MRVATYNVHGCIGRDRRFDPARIADILASFDADLIALQEVIVDTAGELVHAFEAATGMQAIDGSLFDRGIGRYGNLVLTRAEVIETGLHDLSYPGREPRGCVTLVLATQDGPLGLLTTHLGLRSRERTQQMDRLARIATGADRCDVLLGDFNAWFGSRTLRPLRACGFTGQRVRSFPTWPLAVAALDRIIARPPVTIARCWRLDTPQTRIASDHFPVVAELRVDR